LNTTHREFGRHLRDERERRGLILQAIADSTKVPLSMLAGLERGDIEDWPGGLFGRAHLRAYATAVGLSPEPLLNEFVRLRGNDGNEAAPGQALSTITPDEGLRLTLAEDRRWDIRSLGMRALAVALDVCGIVTITAVSARILLVDLSLTCALVTLAYYSLTTMALGQSVTLWWLGGRVFRRTVRNTANARNVLLMPRRQLRAAPRQESPVDFRDNSSASVAQAASR
jgi:transcriptional regulator with XRE-family HTH domain